MNTSAFKTVTMEIPEEMAPAIRRDIFAYMDKRKAALSAELDALKATQKAMRNGGKTTSEVVEDIVNDITKRASKRVVKGRILDDLASLQGVGCPINEIANRLNVSYGTTHRAVMELIEEGKLAKGDDNRVRVAEEVLEL